MCVCGVCCFVCLLFPLLTCLFSMAVALNSWLALFVLTSFCEVLMGRHVADGATCSSPEACVGLSVQALLALR